MSDAAVMKVANGGLSLALSVNRLKRKSSLAGQSPAGRREVAQDCARIEGNRIRVHPRSAPADHRGHNGCREFPFDTPEVVAPTEHAVLLRYDDIWTPSHLIARR